MSERDRGPSDRGGASMVSEKPPSRDGEGRPRIRVVDRRHWAGGEGGDDDAEPARKAPTHVEKLERMIEEKDDALRKTLEEHRRMVEEYEASSLRVRKEAAGEAAKARKHVFLEILPVLDNFERALRIASESRNVDSLIEGVELTRTQLLEKLRSFGVTRFDSLGEEFDPALHEVISQVPVEDPGDDGRVVGVISEGYRIGEELLRPAKVAVGKHGDE